MFSLIFAAVQKHLEMKIADFIYGIKDGVRALEDAEEDKREAPDKKVKQVGFSSANRTDIIRAGD